VKIGDPEDSIELLKAFVASTVGPDGLLREFRGGIGGMARQSPVFAVVRRLVKGVRGRATVVPYPKRNGDMAENPLGRGRLF
jgi:hypothetical protein